MISYQSTTCQGHDYNGCLHYAFSSWSPGAFVLFLVIIVAVIGLAKAGK